MIDNLIKLFILFISACVLNIHQAIAVENFYNQSEVEIARSQPDNEQLVRLDNLDVLFKLKNQSDIIKTWNIRKDFFKKHLVDESADKALTSLIIYQKSQKIALRQQQFTYATINGYFISYHKYPQFIPEKKDTITNL